MGGLLSEIQGLITRPVNVLVTSISKKVPLLVAIRHAFSAYGWPCTLHGGDADATCIGHYWVDHFWPMPLLKDLPVEELIAYCTAQGITVIFPTRDRELPYFARHKTELLAHGIHVMVSPSQAIEMALDKLHFYQDLSRMGFPVIETADSPIHLNSPESYVVKERTGAGGRSILLHSPLEEAVHHARLLKKPIYQPYITGEEYSVDLYVSQDKQVLGTVARQRNRIEHGEAQVSTTKHFAQLETLCQQMALAMNIQGHAIFQALHQPETQMFKVIECNPRFGGASTLSFAAGLHSVAWAVLESQGISPSRLPFNRSVREKQLIRYATDRILDV